MTELETPEATRAVPLAARWAASGVVVCCAALFLVGVVLWARETTLVAERWSLPDTWTAAGLRRVAVEAGVPVSGLTAFFMLLELVVAIAGTSVGVLLLRGSPTWFRLYVAMALSLWVCLGGAIAVVYGSAVGEWALGVQGLGWMAVFPILYVFPDGRFVPPWTRWLVLAWAAYLPILWLLEVMGRESDPESLVEVLPVLVLFATVVWAGVYRYRRVSSPEQQRQTRWLVSAVALWLAVAVVSVVPAVRDLREEVTTTGLVANAVILLASYLAVALIPLSIGVAVLRYRLFNVDVWVARSLVSAALTLILVAVYASLAALGGLWWPSESLAGPLLAVVAIAVVLHPLRLFLQRYADRFVYGHSLEPKALLASVLRSRERILVAREDERTRLQRDLHDGLGPTLASLYQRVEAARALVVRDPEAADRLLADVGVQTRAVIGDIRGLVHALRPPELDQLGLAGSIASAAARLDQIEVTVAGDVGPLPSVVEIAAYRIVTEAVTNAARHAGAAHVHVDLAEQDGTLVLQVTDDGHGLPESPVPGTGLSSMRERAEELGGTCSFTTGDDGGTIVNATLQWGVDR